MKNIIRKVREAAGREDGQSLVEFALIVPLMAVILFGLVEVGNAFTVAHGLSTISREGANIAARGTQLDTVLTVVMATGSEFGLPTRGGSIATEVTVQSGVPMVTAQTASSGYAGQSRIGALGAPATQLSGIGLSEGTTHYVVEVFFDYQSITPLSNFVSDVVPSPIYERAVF
ncbi:MAG: TadE/TadG family type IV pilus assembly protein [Gemmatimonadota bacterium]